MIRVSHWSYGARLAALAGLYIIAGKLGLKLALIHPSATTIWAPTGIAIGSLIVGGYDLWPAVTLGAFFVNLSNPVSPLIALGIASGNTLEALCGAYLVRTFCRLPSFKTPEEVMKYTILAALVSTMVSASLGIAFLHYGGYAPAHLAAIWKTWWLGDATGALIFGPFVILWLENWRWYYDRTKNLQYLLLVLLLTLVVLVAHGELYLPPIRNNPLMFLCLPVVLWTAFQFGTRETATVCVLLTLLSVSATWHGWGPFGVSPGALLPSMFILQSFLAMTTVVGLAVASAIEERDRNEDALRAIQQELEQRVDERSWSLARVVQDLKNEVAQNKMAERSLRESEERFRLLVQSVKDYAIFMLDPKGCVISWNDGAERIKGYTAEEIIGQHFSVFFPLKDIEDGKPERELEIAKNEGRVEDIGVRIRKDGTVFWADVVITALFDKKGNLRGFAKVTKDITETKRAEAALRESEERFRQLVNSNIIGFILMDEFGQIIEANEAFAKMIGYSKEELLSKGLNEFDLTPPQYHTVDQWMRDRLAHGGASPAIEKEYIRKDGARVPVLVGMVQIKGKEKRRLAFVVDSTERRSAQDALRKAYDELEIRVQQRTAELQAEVSRREKAEEELRNQAIRDALTGLYNRRGFMMLAEQEFKVSKRQGKSFSLFMADLDDLKPINDTFGHAEGDFTLVQAGNILRKAFRQSDIIARIGGDEFAIAAFEDSPESITELKARLQEKVQTYNRYSGRPYKISISLGAAHMEPGDPSSLEQLMQRADADLYHHKKQKPARSTTPIKSS